MVFIGRKIAVGLAILTVISIIALVLLQPSGVASAGFSRGVATPMDNVYHLAFFVTIGIWGAWLGREATVLLPFTCMLMLAAGMVAYLPSALVVWQPAALVVIIQLYALTLGVMSRRHFLLGAVILGSVSFYLGHFYLPLRPDIAPALYYIVGVTLCGLLMMAIGGSIGLATSTLARSMWRKPDLVKPMPKPKRQPANI